MACHSDRTQHIHITVFLSATTSGGVELDTCIISAVKLLPPSRGSMGRVMEPTKNPGPAAWIPNAPHGAEVLLDAAGLLSRSGLGLARPSW